MHEQVHVVIVGIEGVVVDRAVRDGYEWTGGRAGDGDADLAGFFEVGVPEEGRMR